MPKNRPIRRVRDGPPKLRRAVLLRRLLSHAWLVVAAVAANASRLQAQDPAPLADGASPAAALVRHGRDLLAIEDPLAAWQVFRQALLAGDPVDGEVGLGNTHLMLGQSAFALAWAEAALRRDPANQDGMALCVRAMIRARQFDGAVSRAASFLARTPAAGAELHAASASALFRVQRIDDAASGYRRVLALDPRHAEGHLRLGSGLLPPMVVAIPAATLA